LQYNFQSGQAYIYDVKIVADLPDATVVHEGSLTYTVLSRDGERFTLKCSGGLGNKVQSKGTQMGPRHMGPPHLGPHRPSMGPFSEPIRPEGTTFNCQGEVVMAGKLQSLPFLLGYQEDFVIEPLPKDAKAAWDKDRDLGVVERQQSSRFVGPFSSSETNRGAKERSDFSVLKTEANTVGLSKKYSLKTAPEANGVTHIDMSGSGELVFDLKQGVFQSQSMKYEIRVNENNISATIPMTVSYRLLTAAEAAERNRKADEAAAAAAEAAKPKAVSLDEYAKLLADLRSGNEERVVAASKRLAKAIPDDHRADVSAALAKALGGFSSEWTQADILGALKVWFTPDAEPAIIEASKSNTFFVRDGAIGLLGNFKTRESAEAVVAAFTVSRHTAAASLKSMGRVAEPLVIPLLKDRDFWVRSDACSVLSEIGGKNSLAALREQAAGLDRHNRIPFDHAIEAVQNRIARGDDKEPPPVEKPAIARPAKEEPAKAEEPARHTWHDVTGTFEIEATFIRLKAEKVTLKKADGRTINVPLAKLSDEDQDYAKKQAAKADNPFD
jgi:HEAT repeat protein